MVDFNFNSGDLVDDVGTEWRFKIDFIPVIKPFLYGNLF